MDDASTDDTAEEEGVEKEKSDADVHGVVVES